MNLKAVVYTLLITQKDLYIYISDLKNLYIEKSLKVDILFFWFLQIFPNCYRFLCENPLQSLSSSTCQLLPLNFINNTIEIF